MNALDRLIPAPRLVEVDSVDVAAPPAHAWSRLRHGDLGASPVLTDLDELASTPERPGFRVLVDDPPREVAVGAIGRSWEPEVSLAFVAGPVEFLAFAEPGYAKVAWALRVRPRGEGGARVELELRADATTDEAWSRLSGSDRILGPGARLLRRAALEGLGRELGGAAAEPPRDGWRDVLEGMAGVARIALAMASPFRRGPRSHWGLSAQDAAAARPGDELLPAPRWGWTHAVEIDAPASEVWPWVAQIGADRGGFYSYQALENAVGCHVRNADAIHPEAALRVGDGLVMHPKMPPMPVVSVVPGERLLAAVEPDPAAVAAGRPWVGVTWLLQVEPTGPRRCRFVSRYRTVYSDDPATLLGAGPVLLEPVSFAMDRRMLLGVKERAERGARAVPPAPAP